MTLQFDKSKPRLLLLTEKEKEYLKELEKIAYTLTKAELDTLIVLVENGPLWDGDIPSPSIRDTLIDKGLVTKIVMNSDDGYQAANYKGRDVYCVYFEGDTIREANVKRLAK